MSAPRDGYFKLDSSVSRRRLIKLGAAAAGVSALAETGLLRSAYGAEPSGKTFTIGAAPSLTGLTSAYQYLEEPGFGLAAPEINATGGILGRMIKFDTRDNQSTPATLPGIVNYFSSHSIDYMVGPEGSSLTLAAVTTSTPAKIIQMAWSDDDVFGDASKYPYFYQPVFTTAQEAKTFVNYAINILKAKRIGVINTNDAFGQSGLLETQKVVKGHNVDLHVETIPIDASSLDTYVSKLKAADSQVIIVWIAPVPTLSLMFKSLLTLGWAPPVVGHSTLLVGVLKNFVPKALLDKAYGFTYKSITYTDKEPISPRVAEYGEKIRKTTGAKKFGPAMIAESPYYDWFYILKKAIESANTFDVAAVKAKLDHLEYDGVIGPIKFTPSNHSGIPQDALTLGVAGSLSESASSDGTFARRAPGL